MAGFRDNVVRWTDEGAPFELIAERIGRLPASEEDKSALWLWARSHRGSRRYDQARRRVLAD
jgi:hypothetical protein